MTVTHNVTCTHKCEGYHASLLMSVMYKVTYGAKECTQFLGQSWMSIFLCVCSYALVDSGSNSVTVHLKSRISLALKPVIYTGVLGI